MSADPFWLRDAIIVQTPENKKSDPKLYLHVTFVTFGLFFPSLFSTTSARCVTSAFATRARIREDTNLPNFETWSAENYATPFLNAGTKINLYNVSVRIPVRQLIIALWSQLTQLVELRYGSHTWVGIAFYMRCGVHEHLDYTKRSMNFWKRIFDHRDNEDQRLIKEGTRVRHWGVDKYEISH